ncbi:zinc ribbon domain-containing protein [Balneolaceae bacterium YR4-1]|uniref:Zinc ribbon domain-containing protein n=1 Tax=Halalkalibaculum roseum TaxID=2709311 RepID=A0A6M1T6L8_9BACT|nr:FmdB family zinc ribbon protein [Halalkalibaculum roseum]NGP77595.1 zinc ribbon domain-containing protein [Halalkalibaculum roseum]
MPTYEYKRKDGTTFEIRQSINDDALTECPETGQPVKRVITGGGGVVYKGDGWYVTDYKDTDRKEAAKREKEQSKNGSTKASKKDEKKTSAKSENTAG